MATEAYLEVQAHFDGRPLADVIVATLYDADSDDPHGSLTTPNPLPAGERGGPLVILGNRDGKRWRVTLPQIEVYNKSAVGCEYMIFSGVQREMLEELPDPKGKKAGKRLENLGATF